MLLFLEVFSITLGLAASAYPLLTASYFVRTNKLGRASAWMFVGEGVGMSITTIFAWLAFTGLLVDLSGFIQSLLRIALFSIAIITSYRLHLVLRSMLSKRGMIDD